MSDEQFKITITNEDLNRVQTPITPPAQNQPPGSWGRVDQGPAAQFPAPNARSGSILMQGWFYLGLAGLLGAFLAWVICEPTFYDSSQQVGRGWGNILMVPLVITFLCIGLGIAESIVEHSLTKAIERGCIALGVGLLLGFGFNHLGNVVFTILLRKSELESAQSPGFWIVRGISWTLLGVAAGLVFGLVGRSSRKCLYGIIGGAIGAAIGGGIFDPISLVTHGGGVSRMVGFSLLGTATGIAVGLVESAMKDRWLYVTAGPLAGKQFILYRPRTIFGSQQANDIYLFKDSSLMPQHAAIALQGGRAALTAFGPVTVNGQMVQHRMLRNGDQIVIGRYTFNYQEKAKNQ